MPVATDELESLASTIHAEHGRIGTAAASVIAISRQLFLGHARASGMRVAPLLGLIEHCVYEWADRSGSPRSKVDSAIASLLQAGQTAEALDALPEDELLPVSMPIGMPGSRRYNCMILTLRNTGVGSEFQATRPMARYRRFGGTQDASPQQDPP